MERIFMGRGCKRSGRSDTDSRGLDWGGCYFSQTTAISGQRSYEFGGEKGKSGRVASVTAPFCLAVAVIAALILGLVEAARYEGLRADASEWTNLALESMFAGYQPELFEKYGMFFLDGGYGTGEWKIDCAQDEIEALLFDNLMAQDKGDGINLYRMSVQNAQVVQYRLATDDNGNVFAMQAAKVMKKEIGTRAAKKILDRILGVENQEERGADPEKSMENAQKKMDELASLKDGEGETMITPGETAKETPQTKQEEPPQNPLETVGQIKKQGILTLVLPAGKTISGKSVSVDNCLIKRNCQKGNDRQTEQADWYERILLQEYIKPHAGNAVSPKEDAPLAYGTEYLICGKGSDEENLKSTVTKLLLVREVANFLYLQTDEIKKAEALSVATAIAAALAAPPAAVVIQEGILAAWAWAESVCDVKTLLAGGNVQLMKTAGSWNTQLSKLAEAVAQKPDTSSDGFSYEQYLDALLYGQSLKKVAYRSMDLMEQHLRREEGGAQCRMDYMLVGAELQIEYDADAIFTDFFDLDDGGGYWFVRRAKYVYDA